jgi:hypothetical protein
MGEKKRAYKVFGGKTITGNQGFKIVSTGTEII